MVPSVSLSAWTVPLREGSQNESRPNDYVAQITDAFAARIDTFIAAMTAEDGVRLPGSRRDALAARAAADGVDIPDALHQRLIALAAS